MSDEDQVTCPVCGLTYDAGVPHEMGLARGGRWVCEGKRVGEKP